MSNEHSALKQQAVAMESDFNDKTNRFLENYLNVPASVHYLSMKKIYLYVVLVSLLSAAMVLGSGIIALKANRSATEKLVRIDGVVIEEREDLRRNILLQNTKERARLRGNMTKTQQAQAHGAGADLAKTREVVEGTAKNGTK